MRQNISCLILALLVVFFAVSCSKNSPSSPVPEATPVPTSTPIPPLFIDNFEDADYDNLLTSQWLSAASGGTSQMHSCLLYTGPNKNGSYALAVSATAQAAISTLGSSYYGMAYLHTGSVGSATPTDISQYGKLKFSAALCGAASGSAYPVFFINLYGGASAQASKQVSLIFDPVFKEYSINLSDFTVSSGTLAELKSALKQILFNIYVYSPVQYDTADIQFYIDDVRFEQ